MESIDIRLENDVVRLTEDQAVYQDQPIQNDRYKPVAFPAEHCLYCVDGKLHYEYNKNVLIWIQIRCSVCRTRTSFLPLFP